MSRTRLPAEHELIPYEASFPPGRRWLVLAPHPDDETVGPGATLAAARERGVEVAVAIATDGAAQGESVAREAEARAAAEHLGIAPPTFWRFEDRALAPDDQTLRAAIARALESVTPDLVLVTSPLELHPDHRALALALQRVLRRRSWLGLRRCAPAWVACYEVATPIRPNLLVAADATWERKRAATAEYRSQLACRPYDEVMEAVGSLRRLTLEGVSRAEAFGVLPAATVARLSRRGWSRRLSWERGVSTRA